MSRHDVATSPYFDEVPQEQLTAFQKFAGPGATKSITCDGHEVPYIDRGTGSQVVLFCHGAFMRGDMFHVAIAQLQESYRVIAPTFSGEAHDVLQAVKAIEEIRKAEGIDTFTVVGYSFGGAIAQYLMYAHPDWLDGAVLSHTTNLFRSMSPGKIRFAANLVRLMPFSLITKKMRARRAGNPADLEWSRFYNAYFEETSSRLQKRDLVGWLRNTACLAGELNGTSAPPFSAPVLILGTEGDEDTFSAMPELKALYPSADQHVFQEAGGHHYVFLHPETYARAIDTWLTDKAKKGASQ